MKEILEKAKQEGYAVAAYNINNLEITRYILEACQESNSPIILEVSEGTVKYMGGYNVASAMVKALVKDLNITMPVALHLDHGLSVSACIKAIDAGFDSVMIDASHESIENNIKYTKEVVEYAHSKGVTVEAEIGIVGGQEDSVNGGTKHADPDEALRLVKETNVDFLAPALGSVHGLYKGTPHIDFVTTKKISEMTNIPLVLHGGTGIPDDMLLEGINSGICKVNIKTELQIVWAEAVRKFLQKNGAVYDSRAIISSGENAIKEAVKHKNELLGSANKG